MTDVSDREGRQKSVPTGCSNPHWCRILRRLQRRGPRYMAAELPPRTMKYLRPSLLSFCVAATLCCVAVARADRVAVLPLTDAQSQDEQAVAALSGVVMALAAQGNELLTSTALAERLPSSLRGCDSADCADEVGRAVHTEYVVSVRGVLDGEGYAVRVSLVTPQAQTFSVEELVVGQDVELAARTALYRATERMRLGPGPYLSVAGEPAGAQVLVDGVPVGILPVLVSALPGTRQIEVRKSGATPVYREVVLPTDPAAQVDVEVAPGAASILAPLPESKAEDTFRWTTGTLLGGTGLLLLAGPLYTLAATETCDVGPSETCRAGQFGAQSLLLSTAAVALISGAIVVLLGE